MISFDRQGLLDPHSAYMIVGSTPAACLEEMSASSTPLHVAAMIIAAAMVALPSNPTSNVCASRRAVLAFCTLASSRCVCVCVRTCVCVSRGVCMHGRVLLCLCGHAAPPCAH